MITPAEIHTLTFDLPGRIETKGNFRKSGNWRERWQRIKAFEESAGYAAVEVGAAYAFAKYGTFPVRLEITLFNQRKTLDCDNSAKSLGDALENVCFLNDSQVVDLRVRKISDPYGPRCRVVVKYLEES